MQTVKKLRSIFRKILSNLSIFHDQKLPIMKKREEKIINFLSKIGEKIQKKKLKNIKKTHKLFSNKVLDLIISKKIRNFLRIDFIQQMFFVHNRLYIYKQLKFLKNDKKNWIKWRKLLTEDRIGNPIKYFLYPISSGNRIREVFHLKNFFDFTGFHYNRYDLILEIGGGYGNMARLFNKINKNTKFIIYDTKEVNLLQYYYLKMNHVKVSFDYSKRANVYLVNSIKNLRFILAKNKKNYLKKKLLIANWSLSETPISLRKKLKFTYSYFDHHLISFQNIFENIDNYHYFKNIELKLNNKIKIKSLIKKIDTMSSALFNNLKHYYFFSKKINFKK